MKFRRDDFIPDGGTLTIRYLPVGEPSEREIEIRAHAEGVELYLECNLNYDEMQDLATVLNRTSSHHQFLKRFGEPTWGDEPSCVVEYEDRTKKESEG